MWQYNTAFASDRVAAAGVWSGNCSKEQRPVTMPWLAYYGLRLLAQTRTTWEGRCSSTTTQRAATGISSWSCVCRSSTSLWISWPLWASLNALAQYVCACARKEGTHTYWEHYSAYTVHQSKQAGLSSWARKPRKLRPLGYRRTM